MKKTREQKGITLIALIITIIILLILAVVTINSIKNGQIIEYAKQAKNDYNAEKEREEGLIENYLAIIDANDPNKEPVDPLKHTGTIPEGGVYYTGLTWSEEAYSWIDTNVNKFESGQQFPEQVSDNDIYIYGDYIYGYNMNYDPDCPFALRLDENTMVDHVFSDTYGGSDTRKNGWMVMPKENDQTKQQYGVVLVSINNKSVISMRQTFRGCTQLTTAPVIPSTVTDLSLTFDNCTSLTGTITINATPIEYNYCFNGVDMTNITLTGECPKDVLDLIGATGNNYTP